MKKQMVLTQAAVLVAMAVFGIGCAKELKAKNPTAPADVTPLSPATTEHSVDASDTARNRSGVDWTSGAITTLTNIDQQIFSAYQQPYVGNNPTDLRISVRLSDAGNNQWVGKVYISYLDNGQYHTGVFVAENGVVPQESVHRGKSLGAYNKWFQYLDPANPRQVFHGFFQDPKGAVMLIIDNSANSGDGGGSQVLSGHIWIKNFEQNLQNSQYSTPCWFVEIGPYDCRTFLNKDSKGYYLDTKGALYPPQSRAYEPNEPWNPNEPSRGWRRLGSFQDLSYGKAFGGQ